MTEIEKLLEAQDFIARELQRKSAGRVDAMSWGQGPKDLPAGIYRLTVFHGGEQSIFTFTKYDLRENYGSRQWKKELRTQVGDILMEL